MPLITNKPSFDADLVYEHGQRKNTFLGLNRFSDFAMEDETKDYDKEFSVFGHHQVGHAMPKTAPVDSPVTSAWSLSNSVTDMTVFQLSSSHKIKKSEEIVTLTTSGLCTHQGTVPHVEDVSVSIKRLQVLKAHTNKTEVELSADCVTRMNKNGDVRLSICLNRLERSDVFHLCRCNNGMCRHRSFQISVKWTGFAAVSPVFKVGGKKRKSKAKKKAETTAAAAAVAAATASASTKRMASTTASPAGAQKRARKTPQQQQYGVSPPSVKVPDTLVDLNAVQQSRSPGYNQQQRGLQAVSRILMARLHADAAAAAASPGGRRQDDLRVKLPSQPHPLQEQRNVHQKAICKRQLELMRQQQVALQTPNRSFALESKSPLALIKAADVVTDVLSPVVGVGTPFSWDQVYTNDGEGADATPTSDESLASTPPLPQLLQMNEFLPTEDNNDRFLSLPSPAFLQEHGAVAGYNGSPNVGNNHQAFDWGTAASTVNNKNNHHLHQQQHFGSNMMHGSGGFTPSGFFG